MINDLAAKDSDPVETHTAITFETTVDRELVLNPFHTMVRIYGE